MDDQRLTKKEFTEKERRFLDISQRLPIDYAALEALLKACTFLERIMFSSVF